MSRLALLGCVLLSGAPVLLAPAALAQPDPAAAPTAGTVELESGFAPAPRAIDVAAGGSVAAADAEVDCPGYVDAAPSVALDYDAGSQPLYLFVRSSTDTVLLVRAPDGTWLCNDDDDGVNAGLMIDRPAGGRYAVWVGTFSEEGGAAPATLYVSETLNEDPALDPSGDPASGTVALASGFDSDPHEVTVMAGGPVSAMNGEGCTGYVDPNAPAVALDLDTDGSRPLYVYARAEGDDDLTLVVSGPDGTLHCNDDADGLNPGVMVEAPEAGRYAVWVGTYASRARTEDPIRATVFFSETEGPTGDFTGEFEDEEFMDDGVYEGGEDISLFAEPAHGTLSLTPGFGSEEVAVEAGGNDAVSVSGMGCAGSIMNGEPDVNVLFGEGEGGLLAFSVEAGDTDTTLILNLPDGSWRCSDDEIGRNPVIVVEAPAAGLYNVWVGTFSEDEPSVPATLRIAEADPR